MKRNTVSQEKMEAARQRSDDRKAEKEMMRECSMCLGPCDLQIHQATVRLHDWFRQKIEAYLALLDNPAPQPVVKAPVK